MRQTPRKGIKLRPSSFLLKAVGLSILAVLLKLALLAFDVFPFNSDEAIVALMARHTLAGEWPTFFYGQAYMGSLDATLVAVGFSIFGQKVFVIRILQALLYSFTVFTTAILGKMIFRSDKLGLLAGLFLVIPTVNTTLYTTVSLGGYGESLFIGNLIMIAALKANSDPSLRWYLCWGVLSGLGFWAFGMTAVFILPTGILLAYGLVQQSRLDGYIRGVVALASMFLGATPLLLWGFENGFGVLWDEFTGSAISGASDPNFLLSIYEHVINLFLFGSTVVFGLRPPWSVRWLGVPLIPLILAFWLVVIAFAIRKLQRQDHAMEARWMLAGVATTLMLGFILTPFGADPSGRYFLPLIVPMALFAGEVLDSFSQRETTTGWDKAIVAGVLLFNLWGTLQSASRTPPGITTQFDPVSWIDHSYDQELIQFLMEQGCTRGYSNYWISYPIAFLSKEAVLLVPKLPYHQDFRYTSRDNRYPPYEVEVARSDHVAYVSTNHPDLDLRLSSAFQERGITWQEAWIGDYHVFYNLSSKITPEDLGIDRWVDDSIERQ